MTLLRRVQSVPSFLFWPAYLFASLVMARSHKFRLSSEEIPRLILEDLTVSLVVAVLCWSIAFSPRRCVRFTVMTLLPTVAFWISLAGLVVVSTLSSPVTIPLLAQAKDLMFVRSALGEATVARSVTKLALAAAAFPVAGIVFGALLDRRAPLRHRYGLTLLSGAAILLVVFGADRDLRHRGNNACVSIARSWFSLSTDRAPTPPDFPFSRFQQVVTQVSNRTESRLLDGDFGYSGIQHDLLVYVLETGVAGVIDASSRANASWLPHINSLASTGIVASRHVTTYSNSTSSIFSIVTGRYPSPDAQSIVRRSPLIPVDTLASVLRSDGYRTAAMASIDGDYDRMDTFLRGHGFDFVADKNSLRLPALPQDSTFGSDWELARRYLRWLDGSRGPTLAVLLPSNSHWPFFSSPETRIFSNQNPAGRYRNSLHEQDRILGFLLAELRQRNRLERTIIAIVPDHGSYFGLAGGSNSDGWLATYHVPVIISHPRSRAAGVGKVITEVTSHVDVAPTLLAMTSPRRFRNDVQGVSWLEPGFRRLVFMIDPTKEVIAATDGKIVAAWNRPLDQTVVSLWNPPIPARDDGDSVITPRFVAARLSLFYRHQYHYLRALDARTGPSHE